VATTRDDLDRTRQILDEYRIELAERQSLFEGLQVDLRNANSNIKRLTDDLLQVQQNTQACRERIRSVMIMCGGETEVDSRELPLDESVYSIDSEISVDSPIFLTHMSLVQKHIDKLHEKINECKNDRILLLGEIERQYSSALQQKREGKKDEKHNSLTMKKAFEVSHQYKSILQTLLASLETMRGERRMAQETLVACENTLAMAADKLHQQVGFLSLVHCILVCWSE
jgi:hypothetical protein